MSRRDDRGQVAGIEALPFGLLVFIGGTLLLVNLWAVIDTKFAADAAAREAARYVVETVAADRGGAATSGAERVARDTMSDHGRSGDLAVDIAAESLARCARVTVTVSTEVDAVSLPFLGRLGPGFTINATHSELVDPTRSGVGGEATCIG